MRYANRYDQRQTPAKAYGQSGLREVYRTLWRSYAAKSSRARLAIESASGTRFAAASSKTRRIQRAWVAAAAARLATAHLSAPLHGVAVLRHLISGSLTILAVAQIFADRKRQS